VKHDAKKPAERKPSKWAASEGVVIEASLLCAEHGGHPHSRALR
jgi:hypothetical protein